MFDTKSSHRLGNDGFVWFTGVVEDIDDPKKLGRARVRILGDHTQSRSANRIPIDGLPWSYPISGINTASMNGIGFSPTGVVLGSWVFGFYWDGIDKQMPVIMGSLGGIPENPSEAGSLTGFQDPDGVYPIADFCGEPDTNRLARGDGNDHNFSKHRKTNLTSGISGTGSNGGWDEPANPYKTEYPFNFVYEGKHVGEWGVGQEFDATPGEERYHRFHPSGNYIETDKAGNEVRKIYGDHFEIDLKNKKMYIKGNWDITVDGDKNELIKGNSNVEIMGNYNLHVHKNKNENVDVNRTTKIGSTDDLDAPTATRNHTSHSMKAQNHTGTYSSFNETRSSSTITGSSWTLKTGSYTCLFGGYTISKSLVVSSFIDPWAQLEEE